MTRSSTRSYWLSNDSWYTVKNGKFVLTSVAPPEAKRSFAEWNNVKTFIKDYSCKIILMRI